MTNHVDKNTLPKPTNCESCEHYDLDEILGEYSCAMSLDEDEMLRFLAGTNYACPYYKFYDEYKLVQKQI